jgi:hypothetical protein
MDNKTMPATDRQKVAIARIMPILSPEQINKLTKHQAWEIIANHSRTWRQFYATNRQKALLRRWGLWRDGLTRGEASDLIDAQLEGQPY